MNLTLPTFPVPTHQVDFGPDLFWLQLWQGDAYDVLRTVPSNSVHCWMTSPPYWRLRDYGWEGQLGHEKTLRDHIRALVRVFRELRRTLHPTGTLYVNYGDAYAQHGKAATESELFGHETRSIRRGYNTQAFSGYKGYNRAAGTAGEEFARKQLMMIPSRLAIAMQEDGWWVRALVKWSKPNALPESVRDRPSKTHEDVIMCTKRPDYFYDDCRVRDCAPTEKWGRRLRSVWTIATEACKLEHYATFPRELVRRCILPSTSRLGCCPKCFAPVVPVYQAGQVDPDWQRRCGGADYQGSATKDYSAAGAQDPSETKKRILKGLAPRHLVGGKPGCKCRVGDTIPCLVGDCFGGVGTVCKVGLANGLRGLSIDGSPEYTEFAWQELGQRAQLLRNLRGAHQYHGNPNP